MLTSAAERGGNTEVNDDSGPFNPSDRLPHIPHTYDCAYNDMIFDANVFDEYYRIVSKCHAAALATYSEAFKT